MIIQILTIVLLLAALANVLVVGLLAAWVCKHRRQVVPALRRMIQLIEIAAMDGRL